MATNILSIKLRKMKDSTITDYFKAMKQEPVFETESFNLNASLEYTSTVIKSEQQCYIKEEIDIPDDINNTDSDCDSLCMKPRTDLINRTCLIVINRLSDSVLQKYLTNKKESEQIIGGPVNLYEDNVGSFATENQRTEIMKNNGKSNSRKRKRSGKIDSDITKVLTSMNRENIENIDANSTQKEIIEDNNGENVNKRRKDADLEATTFGTSPSKHAKHTTHAGKNKQQEIINGEKKVRKRDRTGPASTECYRSFCPKCEKTCKTRRDVAQCRHCKSRLMHECKKCRKQLGSHHGMANHVRGSCFNQGYYYECFKCGFKSPLKTYVSRHLRKEHPNSVFPERIKRIASKDVQADVAGGNEIDECSKCGQKFSTLHKLMKHIQICNGSKVAKEDTSDYAVSKEKIIRYCSKCNETVKDAGTHKILCIKCQTVLAFKCSICQKLYTSCFGAINHIVKIHIKREWRCSKCDFKSALLACLTSHYKRMHNTKVFECTKCGTTWKGREHLARHLKKCGVKRHLHCAHCSYKTGVRSYLQMHILRVHFQEDQSKDQSVACPKCQKICTNDTILRKHLKNTCEKEARFQCEHCSFKTKFKCSIMKHILRHHSAGSKYECSKCKDQFKNNTRLEKHLLVCGKKRSLQCKMCSFKTSKVQYLGWHVRNNHQNDDGIIS